MTTKGRNTRNEPDADDRVTVRCMGWTQEGGACRTDYTTSLAGFRRQVCECPQCGSHKAQRRDEA